MIGVTIRKGKVFKELSDEAVDRFKYYTGIYKVLILDTDKNPYLLKLRLHTFLQQTFVYFDSDLWFVNKTDFNQFDNSRKFYAAKDIGRSNDVDFPRHDCYWNGIYEENYFNTGLFIANGRESSHQRAFEYAWGLKDKLKVKDFGEQTFLNIAVQRIGVPIGFLPEEYNYPIICDEFDMQKKEHQLTEFPKAIHALGFKGKEKLNQLTKYSITKSHEPMPMQDLSSDLCSSITSVLP